MSPFIAFHATGVRHRESIRKRGLLAGSMDHRPFGVYVYRDDYGHPTFGRGSFSVRWGDGNGSDVWQVAHIGPMSEDHFVENGIILHDPVPPQHLTLITHITPNSGRVSDTL